MSPTRRSAMLYAALLAVLAMGAGWSVMHMADERAGAVRAVEELADCKALADEIERGRLAVVGAASRDLGDRELGQRIKAASAKAALPDGAMVSVALQKARRVGDTAYMEKPVELSLRRVSLPQLTMFLYHLTAGSELTVREMRIRSPRGQDDENRWDAEATLTYLVYAPQTTRRD